MHDQGTSVPNDSAFASSSEVLHAESGDTVPVVYHNNGGTSFPDINQGHVYWTIIQHHLFRNRDVHQRFKRPEKLDIVLCHNYPTKPIAARSLEYIGIHDYVTLGGGIREWKQYLKLEMMLEYLQTRCRADYVLHLDAGDVLICSDPATIVQRFLSDFDCDALFNAEKVSSPGTHLSDRGTIPPAFRTLPPGDIARAMKAYSWVRLDAVDYDKVRQIEQFETETYPGSFPHLNSGCYIGRRDYLIELLKEAVAIKGFLHSGNLRNDDQVLIRELHRTQFPSLKCDHENRVFQCMFMTQQQDIKTVYPLNGYRVVRLKMPVQKYQS